MSIFDFRLSNFTDDVKPIELPIKSVIPRQSESYKAMSVIAAALVVFWCLFGGMVIGALLAWVAS